MKLLVALAVVLFVAISSSEGRRLITDYSDIEKIRINHRDQLQIRSNSWEYGPLCQENWGEAEAKVACRQLGEPSDYVRWHFGHRSFEYRFPPPGLKCRGNEESFSECEPDRQGQGCLKTYFIVRCQ